MPVDSRYDPIQIPRTDLFTFTFGPNAKRVADDKGLTSSLGWEIPLMFASSNL